LNFLLSNPSSMHQRRGATNNMALFMFAMQIMQVGFQNIPPGTLFLMILNVVWYFLNIQPFLPRGFPFEIEEVCIGAAAVWYGQQWWRIFLSAITHVTDMHIVYNMTSLMWKGIQIEPQMGTVRFVWMILWLLIMSHSLLVGVSFGLAALGMPEILSQCAVGFSGVLFALKVVLNYSPNVHPVSQPVFFGMPLPFTVPTKHMAWVELIVIHLMMPYTSFIGHLCGVLAGLLYASGLFKFLFAVPDTLGIGDLIPRFQPQEAVGHGFGGFGGMGANPYGQPFAARPGGYAAGGGGDLRHRDAHVRDGVLYREENNLVG